MTSTPTGKHMIQTTGRRKRQGGPKTKGPRAWQVGQTEQRGERLTSFKMWLQRDLRRVTDRVTNGRLWIQQSRCQSLFRRRTHSPVRHRDTGLPSLCAETFVNAPQVHVKPGRAHPLCGIPRSQEKAQGNPPGTTVQPGLPGRRREKSPRQSTGKSVPPPVHNEYCYRHTRRCKHIRAEH